MMFAQCILLNIGEMAARVEQSHYYSLDNIQQFYPLTGLVIRARCWKNLEEQKF